MIPVQCAINSAISISFPRYTLSVKYKRMGYERKPEADVMIEIGIDSPVVFSII